MTALNLKWLSQNLILVLPLMLFLSLRSWPHCQQCFDVMPKVYVLAIRGYEWVLEMSLTKQGSVNLEQAINASINQFTATPVIGMTG